ncbi:MAG: type II toxin-antitoxin system VapC family toxin [Thermoleophilaceae bacterium]
MIAYLDSSALVKLFAEEAESAALRHELTRWPERASSALARVEVIRVGRALGEEVLAVARRVLNDLELVRLRDELLDAAALLDPLPLRSLDAIHVASAKSLGDALGAMITYDERMLAAATSAGVSTLTPR